MDERWSEYSNNFCVYGINKYLKLHALLLLLCKSQGTLRTTFTSNCVWNLASQKYCLINVSRSSRKIPSYTHLIDVFGHLFHIFGHLIDVFGNIFHVFGHLVTWWSTVFLTNYTKKDQIGNWSDFFITQSRTFTNLCPFLETVNKNETSKHKRTKCFCQKTVLKYRGFLAIYQFPCMQLSGDCAHNFCTSFYV